MPGISSGSESQIPERFKRTADLFGAEAFARIRAAKIAVIGLGGVGSHAAIALARSGVAHLLLVDFDRVTASSLNRNPLLSADDIGLPKIEAMAVHLRRTCPDTEIETDGRFVDPETIPSLLDPPPDLVIDAIDSVRPKASLLIHCVRSGTAVLSSMGASARRGSPTIRVADIEETTHCPLARKIRYALHRGNIRGGVTCVYTADRAEAPLPPDPHDPTLSRGRIRNRQPSQICIPGVFGYTLASLALELIADPGR